MAPQPTPLVDIGLVSVVTSLNANVIDYESMNRQSASTLDWKSVELKRPPKRIRVGSTFPLFTTAPFVSNQFTIDTLRLVDDCGTLYTDD